LLGRRCRSPRRLLLGHEHLVFRGGWRRTPDHQQLADHLYRRAAQRAAQLFHDQSANLAVIAKNSDFDQFM
jgi:hypothetical protein